MIFDFLDVFNNIILHIKALCLKVCHPLTAAAACWASIHNDIHRAGFRGYRFARDTLRITYIKAKAKDESY
ncbi:hypothetical protein BMETH_1004_1 [methanotrophic bacterial endosymbiont of Bathymodiolus sp.]|nr:hypothetical protein BMETH_1004_1 [methanotrophic bacterial endosymbiont of Bathymodiolus sp.]